MSPEQLHHVRHTHRLVQPSLQGLVAAAHDTVRDDHPELGEVVPFDPERLGLHVPQEISALIARLDDLPAFRARAAVLGRAHKRYGVTARHYQVFFPALGASMAAELGGDWDEPVAVSWRLVFVLMTQSMLDGTVPGTGDRAATST